jgi:DNA-binding winged helix-turn-helix (wHTH) protein/tetratricopeptide (TPR) repeat protein
VANGNALPGGASAGQKIILTQEQPFLLGEARVSPMTRELSSGTRRDVLEPRVMQVLVALAQARGEIVTRDDLVMRCWHGTVVGENAIQRTISRLRQAAALLDGAFAIETVSGVGYRLQVAADATGDRANALAMPSGIALPGRVVEPAAGGRRGLSRRGAIAAGLGGGVAVATFGAVALLQGPQSRRADALAAQAERVGQSDLPEDDQRAALLLAQATALAPQRADLWGKLAIMRARAAQHGDPTQTTALVAQTQDAARRALALDPRQSDALGSLAVLPPYYGDWLAAERRMDAVLRIDPRHVPTRDERAFLYVAVGRSHLGATERLAFVGADPLNATYAFRLIYAYWLLDRVAEADRAADRAMQLWPRHPGVWLTQLWLLAFTGRPERAVLQVEEDARRPAMPPPLVAMLHAAMVALASRTARDGARAVDMVTEGVRANPSAAINAVMILNGLGAIDRTFAVADAYLLERGPLIASVRWNAGDIGPRDQHRRKTNMLFVPVAAPMRADPRFLPLMESTGLARYWHAAGVVPDFLQRGAGVP